MNISYFFQHGGCDWPNPGQDCSISVNGVVSDAYAEPIEDELADSTGFQADAFHDAL